MSLNKLYNKEQGVELGFEIGCESMVCNTMECKSIVMPPGGDIDAHNVTVSNELKVDGNTNIGGNNYVTPNLGAVNYSLHTDGAGNTFWSPDATGGSGVVYSGIPPTAVGQLALFNDLGGGSVKQSLIVDDGVNFNINGQNITNVTSMNVDTIDEKTLNNGVNVDGVLLKDGLVDGVNVGSIGTDFLKVDGSIPMAGTLDMNDNAILNATFGSFDTFVRMENLVLTDTSQVPKWNFQPEDGTDDLILENAINDEVVRVTQSDKRLEVGMAGESPFPLHPTSSLAVGGYGGQGTSIAITTSPTGTGAIRFGDSTFNTRGLVGYDGNLSRMVLSTEGVGRVNISTELESIYPIKVNDIDTRSAIPLNIGASITTNINLAKTGVITSVLGPLSASEVVRISNGTEALPALSFETDPSTGVYRNPVTNSFIIATNGVSRLGVLNDVIVIQDDSNMQLGSTNDISTTKAVTVLLQSNSAIPEGSVLKIVDSGGNARVSQVLAGDPDNVGVIGVSASSTNGANQDIEVAIGGIFNAIVQTGATVSIGDLVEKSDLNTGRIWSAGPSVGAFGIALTSGTGDVGGTVSVRCMFLKNESF